MAFKHHFPQYMAEFIGTFFLVFFGCGSVVVSEIKDPSLAPFVPVVFGGVVATMIYTVGHISGAHFNPAVTLAFWSVKRFPTHRILGYMISQVGGALAASLLFFLFFGDQHSFGATSITISPQAAFILEFILSFALMFVIISVATDSRAVGEIAGLAIGMVVALCAFVGGPMTSASMNPARTLGPALASTNFDDLWLYLLAPILGALLGAKTYEWIRCQKEVHSKGHGCC